MATKVTTEAVGTAAAPLVGSAKPTTHHTYGQKLRSVTLQPAAAISVGGSDVTVADGLVVAAGATVTLQAEGVLYAIAAADTTCKVLVSE